MTLLKENKDLLENEATSKEEGLEFHYKIALYPKWEGLRLQVLLENQLVTRFEKFGINIVDFSRSPSTSHELKPSHRSFIQQLLRFSKFDSAEECFIIPKQQIANFLERLSK